MADIKVIHQCSVVIVKPQTEAAVQWLETNLGADKSPHPQWPTLSLTSRYAAKLLAAMESQGLAVQF